MGLGGLVSWLTRRIPRRRLQRYAEVAGMLVYPFVRGKRYVDPLDGRGYRRLLPYGRLARRENALAVRSLSLERHRMIWLWLLDEYGLRSRLGPGLPDVPEEPLGEPLLRVLHVAPEVCLQRTIRGLRGVEYVSADLESPWADVKCNVEDLPFEDESFDLILCNHVLEHVAHDAVAMGELYRVLSPCGVAILLVPLDKSLSETFEADWVNTPELREQYYGQADHVRQYGTDYADRLRGAGFRVEVIDYAGKVGEAMRLRYALWAGEDLYLGYKD